MSKTIIEIGGNTNAMIQEKMKTLITELNEASDAYYNGRDEIMTNYEWDAKFDELRNLEMETGIVLPDSPTQKAGSTVTSKLPKIRHEFPALSLAKTKIVADIVSKMRDGMLLANNGISIGSYDVVVMWKMDGGTVVATYDNGKLTSLATRGDGEIGSDITFQAKNIKGIPSKIAYKGHLVVRGEVVMSYKDFERVNSTLPAEEQYKNPRNLATATLQLQDDAIVADRNLAFKAFDLVHCANAKDILSFGLFTTHMAMLRDWGFDITPYKACTIAELEDVIASFNPEEYDYPVDGLVIVLNYRDLALKQPGTGHHPHVWVGYALKWADETEETIVRDIIWSDGRTGALTPVIVFDPVELEGTTVTRASMHNLGLLVEKDIKVGDRVTVYKANKIIPQIDKNLDAENICIDDLSMEDLRTRYNIPERCPECGSNLRITVTDNATVLNCPNPNCSSKVIGNIVHFCSRGCMDIQGMSEATVEFLINENFITSAYGLYLLAEMYEQNGKVLDENGNSLIDFEGWGETSVKNMAESINASKQTTFMKFLPALSIPNIGKGQAKLLAPAIIAWAKEEEIPLDGFSLFSLLCKMVSVDYDFTQIDGFGDVLADNLTAYIKNHFVEPHLMELETDEMRLFELLTFIDKPEDYVKEFSSDSKVAGKTFVITGSVNHYANRDALKAEIESLGGKVSGSVSKSTDYLINNDTESTSGKNKKAKELGVAIISEDDYRTLAGV